MRRFDSSRDYERKDDMEINLPFGSIRASGRMVVIILLVLGLVALGIWHDWKSTNQNTQIIESLHEMTYVISLPEKDRHALNLDAPLSLQKRLDGRLPERRLNEPSR